MRKPTSLLPNINPLLREYLFKKEILQHQSASAPERKNLLRYFFDFLALENQRASAMEITAADIRGITKNTLQHYENHLRHTLNNSEATIFFKLSEIRLFYEDFITAHPGEAPETDPFADYPRTRAKKSDKPLKEMQTYLDFFKDIGGPFKARDRLIFALMMTMGFSDSEICALNLEDILRNGDETALKITGRADTAASELLNRTGHPVIQHPCLPVNLPTALLLEDWLKQRKTDEGDTSGHPLCMTKYKRRMKPGSLGLIFKSHAEKQGLDPEDFTPKALRKFAMQNFRQAGGSDAGLRDYFGCGLFLEPDPEGSPDAFIDNPLITALNQCITCNRNYAETVN